MEAVPRRIERAYRRIGNVNRGIAVIGLPPLRDVPDALVEWDFSRVEPHVALVVGDKAVDIDEDGIYKLRGLLDNARADSDAVLRVRAGDCQAVRVVVADIREDRSRRHCGRSDKAAPVGADVPPCAAYRAVADVYPDVGYLPFERQREL